jgi:hypothetical protein
MSDRLRTALSVTALVVAVLGWSPIGEAAREAVFPPNSVGTVQLRGNAVTSPKIRNGSVQGIDVQKRTLTAVHVRPGSLLASSFKAGQLPAGPKGDKGEKGEKGDRGPAALTNTFTRSTGGPAQAVAATVTPIVSLPLPKGKYVLLGKVNVSGVEPTFTAFCSTDLGSAPDFAVAAAYSGPAGSFAADTLSMHRVVELNEAGAATIRCWTPRKASWSSATLTAVQIG